MEKAADGRVTDDLTPLPDHDVLDDSEGLDEWDEALDELMWQQEVVRLQAEWAADHAPRPVQLMTAPELLDELTAAERALGVIQARRYQLLAEAERRGASEDTLGLSTAGWLVHTLTHSSRRAKAEVRLAARVAAEPVLVEALADGRVSVEQAERIGHGMDRIPGEVTSADRAAVVAQLVGFAADFGPDGLSRLVNHAVEVVAPEIADAADEQALKRLDREQQRDRFVSLRSDPDGGWHLAGTLPPVAGAQVAVILNALATRGRSSSDDDTTWGQAMADALGTVFAHYASCGQAPDHGADRPRVTVLIDYDTLKGQLGHAVLVDTDTTITAQHARRLACDADILPIVLGGATVPLDVGRQKRLFTGPLRQAIIARDRGCVFPGCDRPPPDCEAHHIKPWWDGGTTSLDNGALLCTPHHHLVEPDPNRPSERQWQLHLDDRGLPYFAMPVNPRHPDRGRPRRQHHRFRT